MQHLPEKGLKTAECVDELNNEGKNRRVQLWLSSVIELRNYNSVADKSHCAGSKLWIFLFLSLSMLCGNLRVFLR